MGVVVAVHAVLTVDILLVIVRPVIVVIAQMVILNRNAPQGVIVKNAPSIPIQTQQHVQNAAEKNISIT